MPHPESKPTARAALTWRAAYAAAALLVLAAVLLVWVLEGHRPWRVEVAAINAERGRRLERDLLAAGLEPSRAAARGRELAAEPPRVQEVVPAAFGRPERCLTCHRGIDEISASHPVEAVGCVACHGGQGLGLTKAEAHRGLLGRNPSRLATAAASCGGGEGEAARRCHAGRAEPAADMVYRVERTIMATMTGVLTSLRVSWGAQAGFTARFATAAVHDPRRPSPPPAHTLAALLAVPGGPPPGRGFHALADEHWRKFCARCHLRAQRETGPSAHGEGCAACHGGRDPSGRYLGADAAIADDQPGHASFHRLATTPPEESCRRCHNRSGRLALSYRGEMEDENGRTPWPRGMPSLSLSGGRGVRRLLPDVHAERGMTCIDCHSGREIMGDGRLYGRMRHQTEVRCASCHGQPGGLPATGPPDGFTRYEAAFGPLKESPALGGAAALGLSAKGRPLTNLRLDDQGLGLWLRSQPGRRLGVPLIAADPRHLLPGHRRLACQACHSRWTPQCYGCHDHRRTGGEMWDYASGGPTPGVWQESRDLYRFREPVLGVDGEGRVRPFVPGCQVLLTELDAAGSPLPGRLRQVGDFQPAGSTIVSTPIAPHTTRTEVRPCESCHGSPRTLGLGGGPRRLGRAAAEPLSDLTAAGFPADWEALSDNDFRPLQGQTHEGARPLDRGEAARVLAYARCLPCHRRWDDPVLHDTALAWRRMLPGGDLEASHRAAVEKALR